MKRLPFQDLGGPAKSVFAFGVYLLLLGALLVLAPNALLGLFRIAPTGEVWIRVLGMVVLVEGAYFVLAALAELRAFVRWTVPLRASVLLFFIAFVLTGLAPPVLILFGLVDLAGACWTGWEIWRIEPRANVA
jgi:hypothetical protein